MPDYLTPYAPRRRSRYDDEEDMIDAAERGGRSQAYADLGYVAPKGGVGDDEFYTPMRTALKGKQPSDDPFRQPDYLAMKQTRAQLREQEALYHQQLRDFDSGPGAALKWKPDTQQGLQSRGIIPGPLDTPRDYARPDQGMPFKIQEMTRNDPTNPELVKNLRQYQLLQERRERLADEAQRVAGARQKFDDEVFVPTRNALMGRGQMQEAPESIPDYLAPTEGPWAERIAAVNRSRRETGEAPIRPGTVGGNSATWGPLDAPRQPKLLPDEISDADMSGREPFNPDPRFSSVPDNFSQPPDYLAPASLKDSWQNAAPWDRVKMMFGSKGFGQNEVEGATPMIGSEYGGVKGGLFTIPKMEGTGAAEGVINAVNRFTSGMTTPENVALMAATGGAGALARAGAGTALGTGAQLAKTAALTGFTAQMAANVPQGVRDAYRVVNDPNSTDAEKAAAITTPGLDALMTLAAGHGALEAGRAVRFPGRGGPAAPAERAPVEPVPPEPGMAMDAALRDELGITDEPSAAAGTPVEPRAGPTEVATPAAAPQRYETLSTHPNWREAANAITERDQSIESNGVDQWRVVRPERPAIMPEITDELVDIGPRDPAISTGTGIPTEAERTMLAEQQRLVDEHLAGQEARSDYEKYQDIQQQWAEARARGATPEDPEIQELWRQNEEIKNRNGGMPPEEPVIAPDELAPPAPSPKAGEVAAPVKLKPGSEPIAEATSDYTKGGGRYFVRMPGSDSAFEAQSLVDARTKYTEVVERGGKKNGAEILNGDGKHIGVIGEDGAIRMDAETPTETPSIASKLPEVSGPEVAAEPQAQGDAGLPRGGEPAQAPVAEPTVQFAGVDYIKRGDKWYPDDSTGEAASPERASKLEARLKSGPKTKAAAQPVATASEVAAPPATKRLSDRAIAALEKAKLRKPTGEIGDEQQLFAADPFMAAHDLAIDVAIAGIRAGRAVVDVVQDAVAAMRKAFPKATPEQISRLENTIRTQAEQRNMAAEGAPVAPNPTAPDPFYKHIETERAAGAPLESVERSVMPRAEAQAGAKAAREAHGESGALEKAFAGELTPGHDTVLITDAEKGLLDKFAAAKTPAEKAAALQDFTALSRRAAVRATDLGRQVKFHDEVNRWSNTGLMDAAVNEVANKRAKIIGDVGEKAADDAVKAVNEINSKAADAVARQPDLTNGVKLTKGAAQKVGAKLTKGAPDLDKQIKSALKDLDLKIRDIVKKHYTVGDAAGQKLADKLVAEAGLTGEEAAKLAARVKKRFGELTNDAKKAELEKRLRGSSNLGARSVLRKTAADKLIEASNLGALTGGDQFLGMVAKDLKIPHLTVEQAQRLNDLADKIHNAPHGFKRNEHIQEALDEIRKIGGVSKTDIATAIYYAHILSGPTTQAVNAVSTAINTGLDLGTLALTNPGKLGDVMAGAMEGLQDGMRQGGRTLGTGISDKGLTAKTGVNVGEGLRERPVLEIVSRDAEANPAVRNYAKALRYVGRLMSASDGVFYETAKSAHDYVTAANLAEQASGGKLSRADVAKLVRKNLATSPFDFESARTQATNEGFAGKEHNFRTAEIMRQRRAVNIGGADEAGRQFALNATFNEAPRGVLGMVSNGVAEMANKFPPLKLFVPFTRIVANVANASMNYSPVGLARAIRGKASSMLPGAEKISAAERQQLFVKGFAGTIGTIGGITWALNQGDVKKQPLLTGRGPTDANARNQLRETGWIPYSIKVGDRYYSYLNTPAALPAAIIGNLADKVHYDKLGTKSVGAALASALTTVPSTLTNMTFLQGLAQLAQVMRGGPEGESAVKQWAHGTAGAVVPNLVQQIDRAFDTTIRDSRSDIGTLAGRIPGVRESLPARLTVRGEPVHSAVSDRFTKAAGGDEVAQFIAQNQTWIPGADRPHLGPPGHKRPATDDEYREFQRISGQQVDAQIRTLLPQLRRLKPDEAGKVIDRLTSQARANARVQLELLAMGKR